MIPLFRLCSHQCGFNSGNNAIHISNSAKGAIAATFIMSPSFSGEWAASPASDAKTDDPSIDTTTIRTANSLSNSRFTAILIKL